MPDEIFESAERLATQRGLTRSALYIQALEAFLSANEIDPLTEAINRVTDEMDTRLDPVLKHLQNVTLERDPLVVFRGELWSADLPEFTGIEPGVRRPVLIIQINRFNQSRLATVLAVAVTTHLALAQMPGNVLIEAAASGLEQGSVVNITLVITIDRQFLLRRIGSLPQNVLQRVEQGLRLIQGL